MRKLLGILAIGLILAGGFLLEREEIILAQIYEVETQGLVPGVGCVLKHNWKYAHGFGTVICNKGRTIGPPSPTGVTFNCETPLWAGICTLDGIATVADWIFWITMIAVGIALVFAGLMFISSAGNPEMVKKAKKSFFYSLLGVMVAILAKFIPAFARFFIGV